MKNIGIFIEYKHPTLRGIFLKNSDGLDWHSFVRTVVEFDEIGNVISNLVGKYVSIDDKGRVVQMEEDPSKMTPVNATVLYFDQKETDKLNIDYGYTFDQNSKKFLPTNSFAALSRKQFIYQVAKEGIISTDEAILWASVGTLPQILLNVIDNIPDDQVAFDAKMHLAASTQFERDHPLTGFIGYLLSTPEKVFDEKAIDEIWRQGTKIV